MFNQKYLAIKFFKEPSLVAEWSKTLCNVSQLTYGAPNPTGGAIYTSRVVYLLPEIKKSPSNKVFSGSTVILKFTKGSSECKRLGNTELSTFYFKQKDKMGAS